MQLVEQGRVRLDAPVADYLKRWQLPASTFRSDGVTLARLLSHTAGLSRHSALEITSTQTPSLEQTLSNGSADGGVKLVTEPGTRWDYSGGGYSVTQLLIEEVTGERFADRVRRTIFRPLGMTRSDFELTATVVAESARCYDFLGEPTSSPRFVEVAAAGLYTTLEDLVRFAAAGFTGPDGEPVGRGVVQRATLERMLARVDGADLGDGRWDGMGYFTEPLPGGHRTRGHAGDNRGWSARFEIITENGDGLVVMTNGSNGEPVITQVRCAWIEWLTGTRPGEECKKPLWIPVLHALQSSGQDAARASLLRLQHDPRYVLDENQLNALGYALLRKQRVDDAVAVFEMNVAAFPRAANPRDSLGEAYRRAGKRDLAIASYQKVLELAPDNEHARKMLEELAAGVTP
jgi:CubicO group peptidase (beta-lactamase class C family)